MRIEIGKEYFGATYCGVIRVTPCLSITARGAVISWDCLNLDFNPDKPEIGRFVGLGKRYIFETYDEARKAVFQIKLRIENEYSRH